MSSIPKDIVNGQGDLYKIVNYNKSSPSETFEIKIRNYLNRVADLLISKNEQYGNSAFDPVRIFSRANRKEQLLVRLDDKLSRVAKGDGQLNEEVFQDIIGYLTLLWIIVEEENSKL